MIDKANTEIVLWTEPRLSEVYLLPMGDGMWASVAKRMGVPLWGQVLIVVLVLSVAFSAYPVIHAFDRLDKIESAVRTLAAGSPLHDLIKELLGTAKDASSKGDIVREEKAVEIANAVTAAVRVRNVPATASFFDSSMQVASTLDDSSEVAKFKTTMAEYRSSRTVANVPSGSGVQSIAVTPLGGHGTIILPLSVMRWGGSPGVDMFKTIGDCKELGSGGVSTLALEDGQQTLDCQRWDRVVFVNMHVIYRGGPVELKDVYFVNCTFDFAYGFQSEVHSSQLASAIALGLTSIRIT